MPDFIEYGRVQRPGVGVELASSQVAQRFGLEGALVLHVEPGGPAAEAGIRPTERDRLGRIALGDAVTAVDDEPIRSRDDFILALERREPGETIRLTIRRNGREQVLPITLGGPD
ncbi:MAG: PDZ domain-containing protein [Rhodothermales bacterium]